MFKKYIIVLCLYYTIHIGAFHTKQQDTQHHHNNTHDTVAALSKDQQLIVLKNIAEDINRTQALHEYTLTVPPFTILTDEDIADFLASIPSPYQPKQRKFTRKVKPVSLLDYVHNAWQDVTRSAKKGALSDATREKLSYIRDGLDLAFKKQLTSNNKPFAQFVKNAKMHDSILITRIVPQSSNTNNTNSYVAQAADINKALQKAIISYYDDATVEQLLHENRLPNDLHFTVIIQSFVASDLQEPSVAGIGCSYNPADHNPHITTIETVYGHHTGLKDSAVAKDTYYVLNSMVYPIIRMKATRFEQQTDMPGLTLMENGAALAQRPSLDALAAKDIACATQALEQQYKQPVCLHFIKQNHTLYLISFDLMPEHQESSTNFIDPAYTKKAVKDDAVTITALQPVEHIIMIKDPQTILLARDAQELLQKYNAENEHITVAILEQLPAEWSAHKKLLDQLPIPTFYSSSYTHIKHWINKKLSPLIIDPQAQLMFPYKRRKGFCTLYHSIIEGLLHYPFTDNISVFDTFFTPLSAAEQKALHPEEFFSGVTMEHLLDLLRSEDPTTALRALRSILYRLNTKIKRVASSTPGQGSVPDALATKLQQLHKQYAYIETVAYQLYKKMYAHIKAKTEQSPHDRDLIFLIHILKQLVMQRDDAMVVDAVSFDGIAQTSP